MKKKIKKQTALSKSAPQRPSLQQRRIKIKVVGLGGGGSAIVSEMADALSGVSFAVADTDSRVFKLIKRKSRVRVCQFGEKLVGGMGTGMDVELAKKAALEEKEKITKLFAGQDLVILVGSLGGGVASGAGPVFAQGIRQARGLSLGIFTMPFEFEGDKKMKTAKKALAELRENLSAVVVVPNERIFQIVDKKTPLKKSLSQLNQMFADWLVDLTAMIARPSLINIDFADLRSILKGKGESLFFGQVSTQGPNKAEEAAKKIFRNPLLENLPQQVNRILFNITGGRDLGIKEVELVSRQIAQLNEKAKIIFGVSQLNEYNGRMKISLLALGSENDLAGPVQAVKKTASAKGAKKGQGPKPVKKEKITKKPKEKEPSSIKAKARQERRSALEIKEAQKAEEEKEWANGRDWEIPAFLREKLGG